MVPLEIRREDSTRNVRAHAVLDPRRSVGQPIVGVGSIRPTRRLHRRIRSAKTQDDRMGHFIC